MGESGPHCTSRPESLYVRGGRDSGIVRGGRKTADQKADRPFHARLEEQTVLRYTTVWKRILGYAWRLETWRDSTMPPFRLTAVQNEKMDQVNALIADVGSPSSSSSYSLPRSETAALDRALLELLLSLLDHPLPRSPYESLLLSALAAQAVQPEGGWAQRKTTPLPFCRH